jgi:hypothetical protein
MERRPTSTSSPQQTSKENPRINGSKPTRILRIDEESKKHIRRDGKK